MNISGDAQDIESKAIHAQTLVSIDHKILALHMATGRSQGAVHLMLGVAVSRIQLSNRFRYCPECIKSQYQQYGEYFWQRNRHFPSIAVCTLHERISIFTNVSGDHRHHFYALNLLLNIPPRYSPSFTQWTIFYHDLASDYEYHEELSLKCAYYLN